MKKATILPLCMAIRISITSMVSGITAFANPLPHRSTIPRMMIPA